MYLLPYCSVKLTVDLNREQVIARFSKSILEHPPFPYIFPLGQIDYMGNVSNNKFRLTRVKEVGGRGNISPFVYGKLSSNNEETQIKVIVTLNPLEIIWSIAWYSLSVWVIYASIVRSLSNNNLIMVFLWAY